MSLKFSFLLFSCCILVISYSVEAGSRRLSLTKRQTDNDYNTNDEDNNDDVNQKTNNDDDTNNDTDDTEGRNNDDDTNDNDENNTGKTRASNENASKENNNSNELGSNIRNPMRGMGNRLKDAFGKTYREEKNSISDSWNNMKNLLIQKIQADANLTKTAFDLGTIVPKFGKNFILSRDN